MGQRRSCMVGSGGSCAAPGCIVASEAQTVRGHDAASGRVACGVACGPMALDLIVTMDDATGTIYSAFLVEEEGTVSTFRALLEVFTAHGLPSNLYPTAAATISTPPGWRGGRSAASTPVGRGARPAGDRAHSGLFAAGSRPLRRSMFGTLQDRLIRGAGQGRAERDRGRQRWIPHGLPAGATMPASRGWRAGRKWLRQVADAPAR